MGRFGLFRLSFVSRGCRFVTIAFLSRSTIVCMPMPCSTYTWPELELSLSISVIEFKYCATQRDNVMCRETMPNSLLMVSMSGD